MEVVKLILVVCPGARVRRQADAVLTAVHAWVGGATVTDGAG